MAKPSPAVFNYMRGAGTLDVYMYGVLRGDWQNSPDQAGLVAAIAECAPTDAINLHINSEGGDMFAGVAICNLLDAHPGEVTCIVEGLAASAASIAAMAGRTVMRTGSMMMIHNPWAIVAGDADDMRAAADKLDKSQGALVAIYSEKTGKSETELKALLSAETWMTSAEAVSAGFADDEEDGDEESLDVVAQNRRRVLINNVAFSRNRVPAQILAMAKPADAQLTLEVQPMKTVISALALKDSANEAEVLAAVSRLGEERKSILALTGKDSLPEAMGILAAWKTAAGEVAEIKAAVAEQARIQADKDFDAEIDGARKLGLLASSDDHKRNKAALAHKGKPGALEGLRAFLGALDPLVPTVGSARPAAAPSEPQAATGGVLALSPDERRVADQFGLSHDAMLKNKARLALKAAQAPADVQADDEDAA